MKSPVIEARNLEKVYSGRTKGLSGVSLSIERGSMVGILGHSGAGKTTFMRIINGSIVPTGGSVKVLGHDMANISRRELLQIRRRISVIQQNHNVIPGMKVLHNVLMGRLGSISLFQALRMLFFPSSQEINDTYNVLERLGIADKIFEKCHNLSGGQQQRVAVARAFLSRPDIILADEPVSSVDFTSARLILDYMCELNRLGSTVLINLHQVDFALNYCSRILVFDQGHLVCDEPPALIKSGLKLRKYGLKQVEEIAVGTS